jgi:ribonuclease Z
MSAKAGRKKAAASTQKVGNLYLQALSAGSSDAPPGLLLFCERHEACCYLINCGEGTQRFCMEHKLRMSGKLRRVLFTRMTWEELGGLPGMLLTMASTGHASSLRLHGAAALPRLVDGFRHFVAQQAMPHSTHAVQSGQTIVLEESGIAATPLVLRPMAEATAGEAEAEAADGAEAGEATAGSAPKRQRVAEEALFGDAEGLLLGSTGSGGGGGTAVCWLLEMPGVPPKFDAQAADALQVPKGPLRGELCAGRAATLPDGRVILPEQARAEPCAPRPAPRPPAHTCCTLRLAPPPLWTLLLPRRCCAAAGRASAC